MSNTHRPEYGRRLDDFKTGDVPVKGDVISGLPAALDHAAHQMQVQLIRH